MADPVVTPTPAPTPSPAPAPAAAPAAAAPTIVADPAATPAPDAPPAGDPPAPTWRDDWREALAKGDPKKLEILKRYGSLEAYSDAGLAIRQKVHAGDLKAPLAKDATPEQIAEYRKDNGIPETPEGYQPPAGLVIGEQDKPLVGKFLTAMHAKNASPEMVQTALATYYEIQEQQAAQRADADRAQRTTFEDDLRAEMGQDFRPNMTAVRNLLAGAPEGVADRILGGRTADGIPLGNDPGVIRWLVGLAREINPAGVVLPGTGGNQAASIDTELSGLQKMMGDRKSEYWKGPNAEKNQARFRSLIDAQQKMKARAA